jgi:hypothetical protein
LSNVTVSIFLVVMAIAFIGGIALLARSSKGKNGG